MERTKIFLVQELHDNCDTGEQTYKTTCFSTMEKAKEFFEESVDFIETSTWIRDKEYDYMEKTETSYLVCDDLDIYNVYIEEKEIL